METLLAMAKITDFNYNKFSIVLPGIILRSTLSDAQTTKLVSSRPIIHSLANPGTHTFIKGGTRFHQTADIAEVFHIRYLPMWDSRFLNTCFHGSMRFSLAGEFGLFSPRNAGHLPWCPDQWMQVHNVTDYHLWEWNENYCSKPLWQENSSCTTTWYNYEEN